MSALRTLLPLKTTYPDLALQSVIPLVGTSKRPKSVHGLDLSPSSRVAVLGWVPVPLADVRSVFSSCPLSSCYGDIMGRACSPLGWLVC